ncbi:MAG: TonB-dependent receptor [Betaproteobacteria bacterium]|nr:TonB-dependent receptor [Betaproteobacteria bacterium]
MNAIRWLALAASIAFSAVSIAEDALVVTATRFPERALDAPVGVHVITAAEIEASAAGTLPELLSRLGDLHVRNNSGSPDLQLDLRGFGITSDQNTLVLVDGVRINQNDLSSTRLSSIPLQAIERIEILAGSGAVPYGAGASGGTVNIVTKAPQPGERWASVYGGAGSYATLDTRLAANVGGDRFSFNVYGNHLDSDGYRVNNHLRQDNLLGDLRFGESERHIGLKLGSDWQRLRLPGVRDEVQYASDPRGATTPNDYSFRDGESATIYGRYRDGRAEYAADLAYRGQLSAIFNDGAFPLYGEIKLHTLVFSPRLRLALEPFGIRSTIVLGGDFTDGDYRRRIAGNPDGLANPLSRNAASQRGEGFYAQYHAQFATRTKVTLGWRTQRVTDRLETTSIFGAPTDLSSTHRPHAGEIALRQELGSALALLAKAGTSFRLATVDDNGQTSTGLLLEPQTARHREIGLEWREAGKRVRATLYDIKLDKEIYFSPLAFAAGAFFPGANINLSPTRRSGVELSGGWQATQAWDLAASLNLQSAKFRSGIYGGTDVTGLDVPLVPRVLANVRATWRVSSRTQITGSYRHVGRQRYDNDQDNRFARLMPAYGVADLKLGYSVRAWRFAAGVANLFDKKYFSYGIINNFNCATPSCVYPEQGRSLNASAEYTFR